MDLEKMVNARKLCLNSNRYSLGVCSLKIGPITERVGLTQPFEPEQVRACVGNVMIGFASTLVFSVFYSTTAEFHDVSPSRLACLFSCIS